MTTTQGSGVTRTQAETVAAVAEPMADETEPSSGGRSGRRKRNNSAAPLTTHGACGATWSGSAAAHCSGCCRTFSGTALFDRHRSIAGEHGTCHDPAGLTDKTGAALCELVDGIWRYPAMTDEQKRAAFGGAR